jgi:hypothetical protein
MPSDILFLHQPHFGIQGHSNAPFDHSEMQTIGARNRRQKVNPTNRNVLILSQFVGRDRRFNLQLVDNRRSGQVRSDNESCTQCSLDRLINNKPFILSILSGKWSLMWALCRTRCSLSCTRPTSSGSSMKSSLSPASSSGGKKWWTG